MAKPTMTQAEAMERFRALSATEGFEPSTSRNPHGRNFFKLTKADKKIAKRNRRIRREMFEKEMGGSIPGAEDVTR